MTILVYGAGAVGGLIAARLARQGQQVVVVARRKTAQLLRNSGLVFKSASEEWRVPVAVVEDPRELNLTGDDTVILAMKTQDTLAAMNALSASAPPDISVVCAQNGVENERIALRRFENVYGMCLYVFASSPAAGEVRCFTSPSIGIVDIGRSPDGLDAKALQIAQIFRKAGFDSIARTNIMQWKYTKLLDNLRNAFDASCAGSAEAVPELLEAALAEGRACFEAAGIVTLDQAQSTRRFANLLPLKQVDGAGFPGGSTWQSLAQEAAETEIDYLAGEIVLLGREYDVATPINSAMQKLVKHMAIKGMQPACLAPEELRVRLRK